MKTISNTDKREEIYSNHLKTIRDKNFTAREIDVISCMLHNRKPQTIASLLSITPKTVNTHLYNIVNKIGHNSISIIIDFAERSGKLQYFREYYFYLVMYNLFDQYLRKMAVITRHSNIRCNVLIQGGDVGKQAFSKLGPVLELVNVKLVVQLIENNKSQQDSESNNAYSLHVLAEKNSVIPTVHKDHQEIILLFNEATDLNIKNYKYIDFTKKENFYASAFQLLEIIIDNPEVAKLVKEYNNECLLLQQSWQEMLHIPQGTSNSLVSPQNKKTILLWVMLALLSLGAFAFFLLSKRYEEGNINLVNQQCGEFIEQYSFENIGVTEGLKKNLTLLKNMDETLSNLDHQHIQKYFVNHSLSTEKVLNYLYSVQAVAMHLLYNEYNYLKSRKILLAAKETIECYINHRSNVKIDFGKCSSEELFSEITVIEEFPQIYSKILYLLGRTYTYFEEVRIGESKADQMHYEEYEKYYEAAAYIGSKSGVFEGYLSRRNIIEMVNLLKINRKLKGLDDNHAQEVAIDIYKIIKALEELKSDDKEYILNYRPGVINHEIIIPSNDNYNKLYLTERILQHYSRLLKMVSMKDQKSRYVDDITKYFTGDSDNKSVLDELDGVPSKKVACLYNTIGFILLQLLEQNIDANEIHSQLQQKLDLTSNDRLEQIIQLFDLAKTKSRNSHYPKLHSYKGLVKAYEKILDKEGLTNKQMEEINILIVDYKQKIETLDQQLKQNL